MELRYLQTFAAAAELGSFTRAAKQSEMTQGAVSQQVAALERELSVRLFQRSGRRVELTEAGQRMYEYARQILDLVDKARQELSKRAPDVRGTLRIAASTVPAEWLLPDLLAEFRQRHSQVSESMSVTDSSGATRAVEQGDADVGFVGELPHAAQLTARAIASDELVLVAPADHPLAKRRTATKKHLRSESLIVREPGSGSRRCVEEALQQSGIAMADLTIAMEVNSNEAIRAAVERGVGLGFLSSRTVEDESAAGSIVPIKIRGFRAVRKLYVVYDRKRIPTAPMRLFLEFLEQRGKAPG